MRQGIEGGCMAGSRGQGLSADDLEREIGKTAYLLAQSVNSCVQLPEDKGASALNLQAEMQKGVCVGDACMGLDAICMWTE